MLLQNWWEETVISSQALRVRELVSGSNCGANWGFYFTSPVLAESAEYWCIFPSYITHFSDNLKEEFKTFSALSGVQNWAEITVLTEITVLAVDTPSYPTLGKMLITC